VQAVYRQGYGAVLDSGTTFTYLPSPAFAEFLAAVKEHALGRGLQLTDGPDKNVSPKAQSARRTS
jgi:hypothetical protein